MTRQMLASERLAWHVALLVTRRVKNREEAKERLTFLAQEAKNNARVAAEEGDPVAAIERDRRAGAYAAAARQVDVLAVSR